MHLPNFHLSARSFTLFLVFFLYVNGLTFFGAGVTMRRFESRSNQGKTRDKGVAVLQKAIMTRLPLSMAS